MWLCCRKLPVLRKFKYRHNGRQNTAISKRVPIFGKIYSKTTRATKLSVCVCVFLYRAYRSGRRNESNGSYLKWLIKAETQGGAKTPVI